MASFVMIHVCTICGREKSAGATWFVVAENRWEDKLRIWEWDPGLVLRNGAHEVCSPAHVRELVGHWMREGSLNYPYPGNESLWDRLAQNSQPEMTGGRQLGELYVHRESLRRLFRDTPNSLSAILEELVSALNHETNRGICLEGMEAVALREA